MRQQMGKEKGWTDREKTSNLPLTNKSTLVPSLPPSFILTHSSTRAMSRS